MPALHFNVTSDNLTRLVLAVAFHGYKRQEGESDANYAKRGIGLIATKWVQQCEYGAAVQGITVLEDPDIITPQ